MLLFEIANCGSRMYTPHHAYSHMNNASTVHTEQYIRLQEGSSGLFAQSVEHRTRHRRMARWLERSFCRKIGRLFAKLQLELATNDLSYSFEVSSKQDKENNLESDYVEALSGQLLATAEMVTAKGAPWRHHFADKVWFFWLNYWIFIILAIGGNQTL